MRTRNDAPNLLARYGTPAWLMTTLGLLLGLAGVGYLATHPEPVLVWAFEAALIAGPALILVYGGYWITSCPLDREDQWIVSIWTLSGGVAAAVLVGGYVLTEQLSGTAVNESGRLLLLGASGGSLVALAAVSSVQQRHFVTDIGYADSDVPDGSGPASRGTAPAPARSDVRTRRSLRRGARERAESNDASRLATLLARANEIREERGVRSLASSSRRFGSRKAAEMGFASPEPYHERKRTDSHDRWKMIAPRVSTTDATALDIGCASGFFTARLADRGLLSIGIDQNRNRITAARRTWRKKEGVGFVLQQLDPTTVSTLPRVDVVLLLTVYHHWHNSFGPERAQQMLRKLADRTGKLFFEVPDTLGGTPLTIGETPAGDGESPREYYHRSLRELFDERTEIEYLGEAEYPPVDSRTDHVFLIDSRKETE